jgi:hypothetical protein
MRAPILRPGLAKNDGCASETAFKTCVKSAPVFAISLGTNGGTSGLPIASPDNVRNIDASFDEASERDIAKIIGSDAPDDCHLPSKPRKLYGGVCC